MRLKLRFLIFILIFKEFYFHFFHGDYRLEATPVISSSIGASPNVQFRLGLMTMLSIITEKYGPVAVLIIILTRAAVTHSFKILILYPTPVFSHQRPMLALTERLIKDGHELFVVTPNPVLVSKIIFPHKIVEMNDA